MMNTNKPFAQSQEVLPSAGCVVSLVDRLVHRSEVIAIEGKVVARLRAPGRPASHLRSRRQHHAVF